MLVGTKEMYSLPRVNGVSF